jgi:hypothetical protein
MLELHKFQIGCIHTRVAALQVTYMLYFVDTCSIQVHIDYRAVVQVGCRSVVQVDTVVQWYISQ